MKKNVFKIGLSALLAGTLFAFASCAPLSSSEPSKSESAKSELSKEELIAKLPTTNILSTNPLKGNTYAITQESDFNGTTSKLTASYKFTDNIVIYEYTGTQSYEGKTVTTKATQSYYYNLTGTANNITLNEVCFDSSVTLSASSEVLEEMKDTIKLLQEQVKNLLDITQSLPCEITDAGNLKVIGNPTIEYIKQ